MTDHDIPTGEPSRRREPHRWAAGHVIIGVLVALVLGGLLNADDLLATAERQEFSLRRDVSVAAAERLVSVSRMVGLHQPRQVLDQALGRADPALGDDTDLGRQVDLEDAPQPGDEAMPAPDHDPGSPAPLPPGPGAAFSPDDDGESGGGDTPVAEPETPPVRTPITEDDPLTMFIGGDSMVGQFGMALEDLADDTGLITTTEVVYEFGSGLSRPDFIDWPTLLAEVSAEQEPEVIVLYFGGNDAQALKLDGVVYEPEDEEWQAEYRSRVNGLMTQLQEDGHRVYWMGMPIPRSDTLQPRYRMLNEIYSSEADAHEAVTFVPAWDVFTGPDGGFSEYLPNASGDVVDMRLDDGIHYTTAGAYRIARVAADRIIADHDIPPAP